jgi:hypothetical protein
MPLVEIWTVDQDKLVHGFPSIAEALGGILATAPRHVRIVSYQMQVAHFWNSAGARGSESPSPMVRLTCKSEHPQESVERAMVYLQREVASYCGHARLDVHAMVIRVQPGNAIAARGIWMGGGVYKAAESLE